MKQILTVLGIAFVLTITAIFITPVFLDASSHREAPLISNDPLADNTDLYAFRTPDDTNTITIVANYIPFELPEGGPNYSNFGENVLYEIHIKNQTSSAALGDAKDNITYRFSFDLENEDPTTFFNIRLGKQNLKATYTAEKSTDGGDSWSTIVENGIVPPNNIGPRSIEGAAGLSAADYGTLAQDAVAIASTGEKIFCGPRDDPFFVDLGGIFDLGQTRQEFGPDASNSNNARDGVAGFNVHSIVLQIPIASLQKDGKTVDQAANILDGDFVIGVWASASRQQIKTLPTDGSAPTYSGDWVQVSRLGMPLTNEAVIPIGEKDHWNAITPYSAAEQDYIQFFANPELALYMDDSQYGGAVPALSDLRIQSMSYPAIGTIPTYSTPGFDFRNGKDGAFAVTHLSPPPDLSGTAFAVNLNGGLVGEGMPRLVDIYSIFYFGVPNLIPYQLATGKTGGPLSAGKPFINNFLPITQDMDGKLYGGDMLRLNMAVPVTDRTSEEFKTNSYMGLIRAAAIGLTAAPYNTSTNLEFIPHMDGFPNGRRLEDDVTTIELQAVGGLVLAAVGLPFDDATAADYSDLASAKLVAELTYNAGPTQNDVAFLSAYPYLAPPHRGYDYVKQLTAAAPGTAVSVNDPMGLAVPKGFFLNQNFPNPFNPSTTIGYHVSTSETVQLKVFNALGQEVATLVNKEQTPGDYKINWNAANMASGTYYYRLNVGGNIVTKKAVLLK